MSMIVSSSATATGTTIVLSRVSSQSVAATNAPMSSMRHDQDAAARMAGGTAPDSSVGGAVVRLDVTLVSLLCDELPGPTP
ncbi:hypothetical protein GCM10010102_28700 [Promicromonospora citrea]|uniref:Uncharacterized protein n=1 Tax=Promicromonospora citrea TaxID=43677 RepID=A0A8H9GJH8_9MICO|nr:hypothetical protein GCM10010102_28700 [Promicromonospora citrea]